jgi:sterol desaturase/sphingolipid hydroxylase (fatty acid hydroxylase superfamily)
MLEESQLKSSSPKTKGLRKVSSTSTLCTTPPKHDLLGLVISEEVRYIRKGYGLISATAIAIAYFYFGPIICREWFWPLILGMITEYQWEPWKFMVLCSTIWHACLVVLANLGIWAIYHVELPFFERYKISMTLWPWKESKKEWRTLLTKSIALCLFNCLVSVPLLAILSLMMSSWEPQYSFDMADLPDTPKLMASVLFCMMCEDLTFHLTHRLLHWRVIYPYIHKVHHTYVTTVGITAEYSHPIEFIFGAALPGSVGGLILGKHMHYCTMLLWVFVRIFETLDGHCGYEFSWSPYRLLPFSTSSQYHDFHHSHNVGNYSSFFSIWDTVFGQNH